jgi:hypothetical protein
MACDEAVIIVMEGPLRCRAEPDVVAGDQTIGVASQNISFIALPLIETAPI